jgi:hypothetical protein
MTRSLIAVTSYFPDAERGCHQAIRDGWGRDASVVGADLRFFVPYPRFNDATDKMSLGSYNKRPDEVYLSMDGNYNNISLQVWEILKFSFEHNYDFVFLCCNDTFVLPRQLFAAGFEQWDYSGEFYPFKNNWTHVDKDGLETTQKVLLGDQFDWYWYETKIPNLFGWMGAGMGILLSKKAVEKIVANKPSPWISEHSFYGFAYDVWIGQVLGPLIQSDEILAKENENVSWHYTHSSGELRYANVCAWQKNMREKHSS